MPKKNYPRNINYMPVAIFLGIPRFWKKLLFLDSPLEEILTKGK
jgi:hypothetical protein